MRKPILLLLIPLLTGCALFESKTVRALRASPDYRAGYGDGCASARTSANPRANTEQRDNDAYSGNDAYRLGWQDGLGACRAMATPMPGQMPR